ncbi:hypothetical protein GCM10017687_68020 [Streptomyces echinatus]
MPSGACMGRKHNGRGAASARNPDQEATAPAPLEQGSAPVDANGDNLARNSGSGLPQLAWLNRLDRPADGGPRWSEGRGAAAVPRLAVAPLPEHGLSISPRTEQVHAPGAGV